MAVYKVIQDVEAEDKLLGPLTLKQFIFALICCGFMFAAFLMVKTFGTIFATIPFLPFIAVSGVLAAPIGKDQPTDIWLAARIRYYIKPRKRIWDQNGIKNLVNITVPKKIEHTYSDNLSQGEVKSRLSALADTLDSRGWAIKNLSINMDNNPAYAYATDGGNNRLIDPSSLPQSNQIFDEKIEDDILAIQNPTAQQFDTSLEQSTSAIKQEAIKNMQQALQSQSNTQPTNTSIFAITTNQQPKQTPTQQASPSYPFNPTLNTASVDGIPPAIKPTETNPDSERLEATQKARLAVEQAEIAKQAEENPSNTVTRQPYTVNIDKVRPKSNNRSGGQQDKIKEVSISFDH